MALSVGARIGPYEVTGVLGAGGMGEVYLARDTRLGREVALKVLPAAFASDPDRLARFQREAQVLAALNHQNIAHIYGVEGDGPAAHEAGGDVRALAMELVEGETLLDHLARGPIPVSDVLRLLPQLIDALDTAHEHGIVHRDLKPANIKVREDGTLKVLDFGLAKALDHDLASTATDNAPTITTPAMTRAGAILGTAAYMSPEQARGKRVDKRADIWAFGAVVFEMLSGRRPFDGETVTDTLAAIVTKEPDWTALPADTPAVLRRLLVRCLVKDPRQRLRDIGDARVELASALEAPGQVVERGSSATRGGLRAALPWAVAAVAATLAVVAWTRSADQTGASDEPPTAIRFTVPPPEGGVLAAPNSVRASGTFTISPDGRHLAILAEGAGGSLWVRPIDGLTARLLPGTEGAAHPFWSPDGRRLGFFTSTQLKNVDLETGAVQVVTDGVSGMNGASWSADGTILFSNSRRRIARISASGGTATEILDYDAARGDSAHRWPEFLPDGRHFLLFIGNPDVSKRGVYIGALGSPTASFVVNADASALYSNGRLLYMRGGTLFAQPFDVEPPALSGEPAIVVQNVALNTTSRRGEFSSSRTGVLAYRSASRSSSQVAWFDRSGTKTGNVGSASHVAIAPDDVRVAGDRTESPASGRDVWVFDERSGTRTRLTFSAGDDWVTEWSPDGTHVAYTSSRDTPGAAQIYMKSANGVGNESLLLKTDRDKHHMSWSPDGKHLAYEEAGEGDGFDLWALPLAPPGRPQPLLQNPHNEAQPAFSPDSRYLGYISNESGRFEVYVQAFPATGGRWQVSFEGGIQPRWRRDGRELYYLDSSGRIMALDVDLKAPRFGAPRPLFQTGLGGRDATEHFAVTSDGQRFLMMDRESGQTAFTVVVNWPSLLGAAKP